jgi:hypothetical protein
LAPDQDMDKNYTTIFVQDDSGIYPVYHNTKGTFLIWQFKFLTRWVIISQTNSDSVKIFL